MSLNLEECGYERVEEPGYFRLADNAESFWYNEGDEQEEWVASAVAKAQDRGVFSREFSESIRDWQSVYQLSQLRANLLRPIAQFISGDVLEVGAGMGAISRALGEMGVSVTSLEPSERRARTCAIRTADLPNVQVVCDTIQNFDPGKRFDTIVLVGVLEYSRVFGFPGRGEDPVDQMLQKLTDLLNPNGKLVVAIENQLGLKYLAGFPEDHVGQLMYGIEDRYGTEESHGSNTVTFGRLELGEKIERAGLKNQNWYYPFPDYKLPTVVMTQRALEPGAPIDALPLLELASEHDLQEPDQLNFDMARAWGPILRNGLAPDMSNSFLVVASRSTLKSSDEIAWVYGNVGQRAEFAKVASFVAGEKGVTVKRRPLVPGLERKIGDWERTFPEEPYYRAPNWVSELQKIVRQEGWSIQDLSSWFKTWFDAVVEVTGVGPESPGEALLSPQMYDALPRNLVFEGGEPRFVDLELTYGKDLTLEDLAFRALMDALLVTKVAPPVAGTPTARKEVAKILLEEVGIQCTSEALAQHLEKESGFASVVVGRKVDLMGLYDGEFDVAKKWGLAERLEREWAYVLSVARKRAAILEAQRNVMQAELESVRALASSLAEENQRLEEAVEMSRAGTETLRNTLSWKVTRPLRAVRALNHDKS